MPRNASYTTWVMCSPSCLFTIWLSHLNSLFNSFSIPTLQYLTPSTSQKIQRGPVWGLKKTTLLMNTLKYREVSWAAGYLSDYPWRLLISWLLMSVRTGKQGCITFQNVKGTFLNNWHQGCLAGGFLESFQKSSSGSMLLSQSGLLSLWFSMQENKEDSLWHSYSWLNIGPLWRHIQKCPISPLLTACLSSVLCQHDEFQLPWLSLASANCHYTQGSWRPGPERRVCWWRPRQRSHWMCQSFPCPLSLGHLPCSAENLCFTWSLSAQIFCLPSRKRRYKRLCARYFEVLLLRLQDKLQHTSFLTPLPNATKPEDPRDNEALVQLAAGRQQCHSATQEWHEVEQKQDLYRWCILQTVVMGLPTH